MMYHANNCIIGASKMLQCSPPSSCLLITLRLALQLQRVVVQGVPLDNTSRVVILVDSFSQQLCNSMCNPHMITL